MDLATRLIRWRERPPEHWAGTANLCLSRAVTAILVLALAWQLARFTWTLIPGVPADAPAPVVNPASTGPSGAAAPTVDAARISGRRLFGEAVDEPAEPVAISVLEAPDTTLDLRLKATVSDSLEDSYGAAVISSSGVEKTYTVADIIEGAGSAQLHAIYSDRVILNRAGRLETLRLPREYPSAGAGLPSPPVSARTAGASSLRSVLSENASRITEVIQVAAHIEQGRMVGFRLNPGGEEQRFEALGFQSGDVVTEINGTAMTDPSRGLQVFESLGESTAANVTVIRDGAPRVLTIDTTQLGELAQDR